MILILLISFLLFTRGNIFSSLSLEQDLEDNMVALHVPTFIKDLSLRTFYPYMAFIITQISVLLISLAPIDKIRRYQSSVISGAGMFYFVAHLLQLIPKIPLILLWSVGIIIGSIVGFFSFKIDIIQNISLSIGTGYVIAYMFTLYFQISKLLIFFLTLAVFIAILALLSFRFEKYQYPICRSVICAFMMIVCVENLSIFSLLQPLHGTGVPLFQGIRGTLTIIVFVGLVLFLIFYSFAEVKALRLLGFNVKNVKENESDDDKKDENKEDKK
ncbi:hypothetical protein DMUE_3485 [Dictyocoela muelleri]|nr:hypothetical protein DMUE_3485 [Dictyocoela muelleri]